MKQHIEEALGVEAGAKQGDENTVSVKCEKGERTYVAQLVGGVNNTGVILNCGLTDATHPPAVDVVDLMAKEPCQEIVCPPPNVSARCVPIRTLLCGPDNLVYSSH